MGYFPIFLEMKGRRVLVIGGGAVAERKIAGLLEAGAAVTVISPDVTERISRWSKARLIDFLARRYQPGDLSCYEIVFVATSDGEVNAAAFGSKMKPLCLSSTFAPPTADGMKPTRWPIP